MKVLLDTNVVARTIERGHSHHQPAVQAIRSLELAGHQLYLVPQVLYELWVILTRPVSVNGFGYTVENAHRELLDIQGLFVLLRDERSIFEKWQILVLQSAAQGKTAHDARLIAAMQRHGLTHILTFNRGDFTRFSGDSRTHSRRSDSRFAVIVILLVRMQHDPPGWQTALPAHITLPPPPTSRRWSA